MTQIWFILIIMEIAIPSSCCDITTPWLYSKVFMSTLISLRTKMSSEPLRKHNYQSFIVIVIGCDEFRRKLPMAFSEIINRLER